jgi:hypothetical protein
MVIYCQSLTILIFIILISKFSPLNFRKYHAFTVSIISSMKFRLINLPKIFPNVHKTFSLLIFCKRIVRNITIFTLILIIFIPKYLIFLNSIIILIFSIRITWTLWPLFLFLSCLLFIHILLCFLITWLIIF